MSNIIERPDLVYAYGNDLSRNYSSNFIYGETEDHSAIVTSHFRSLNGYEPLGMQKLRYSVKNWEPEKITTHPTVEYLMVECDDVKSLEWLQCFPSLNTLIIQSTNLKDLAGLSHVHNLKNVTFNSGSFENLKDLTQLEKLEKVSISHCNSIVNLDALRNLPSLKEVDVHDCANLSDISAWTEHSTLWSSSQTIHFKNLPNLTNIGDVSSLQAITEVILENAFTPALFPQLKKLNQLKKLTIKGSTLDLIDTGSAQQFQLHVENAQLIKLEGSAFRNVVLDKLDLNSLSGISGATQLQYLTLSHLNSIKSLDGLESMHNLLGLNVIGCGRLENTLALAKLEKLNQLKFDECPQLLLKPQAFDMNPMRTIQYQSKLLRHLGLNAELILKDKKADLEKQPKVSAAPNLSKIKKLLFSRDTAQIDLGIHFLESLDDELYYNLILEGTSVKEGCLVPNKLFTGTKPAQPFLNYGLLHLLKHASKFELWKSLCAQVNSWKNKVAGPSPFDQFVNLKELVILDGTITELHLKSLEKLEIGPEYGWGSSLSNFDSTLIKNCTGINELKIKVAHLSNGFKGFSLLSNLKLLKVDFKTADLNSFEGLESCLQLETLSIEGAATVNNLSPLSKLADLKELKLKKLNFSTTGEFVPLTKLQSFHLEDNQVIEELSLPSSSLALTNIRINYCEKLSRISGSKWPATGLNISLSNLAIHHLPDLSGIYSLYGVYLSNLDNLKHLNEFTGIQKLDTRKLDLRSLESLENISGIRNMGITSLEVGKIPQSVDLPGIKSVRVTNSEHLHGIAVFVDLEELELYRGNTATLDGIEGCRKLRHIELYNNQELKDISALTKSTVKSIKKSYCPIPKSKFPTYINVYS